MVRYKLKDNKQYVFGIDSNYTESTTFFVKENEFVFVNITDKLNHNWKFDIFFSTGKILRGVYGIPHILGDLQLYYTEDVFDGRFNA